MVSICTDDKTVAAEMRCRGLWRQFRKAISNRPRANCAIVAHADDGAMVGFIYFAGPADKGFAAVTGDPAHVMSIVSRALAGHTRRTLH